MANGSVIWGVWILFFTKDKKPPNGYKMPPGGFILAPSSNTLSYGTPEG